MFKSAIAVAVTTLGLSTTATADHYWATADPYVVQMIQEMTYALNEGCNYGNAGACNAIGMIQQQAHMMLSAGYDCQTQGLQDACAFYQQNVYQLQQAHQQVGYAVQQGSIYAQTGGGTGMGMTHEERMRQIHLMGQQVTANWQQNQQIMDTRHQQFLETLRQ